MIKKKTDILLFSMLPLIFGIALTMVICSTELMASSESGPAEEGGKIFNEKCSLCHTIGGGKKMGPDLKGVTTIRSQEWLTNFISAPSVMFQEGDPAANELLKEFHGFKMTDLSLPKDQVSDVIAYLESQDEASQTSSTKPEQRPAKTPAEIESAARGESLFKEKCSLCHTIGGGKKVGPDLKGVTTIRSREWLTSFISAPDKMFQEGDPAANELLKEFHGFKMIDLKLSAEQVTNVINYLKSKDASIQTPPAKGGEQGETQ